MRERTDKTKKIAKRAVQNDRRGNTGAKSQSAIFDKKFGRRLVSVRGPVNELIRIRTERSELMAGYQSFIQKALLEVYEIALLMAQDLKKWNVFCEHVEWRTFRQPPKKDNSNTALKHALRLAAGFDDKATKFVSRYYRIMQPYFRERTPTKRLAEAVKAAGGFANLNGSHLEGANACGKKKGNDREHGQSQAADALQTYFNPAVMEADLAGRGGVARQLREGRQFAREVIATRRQTFMEAQLRAVLHAFLVARWMLHDQDAWEDFCRLNFWRDRRKRPAFDRPEEGLTFVVLATLRLKDGRGLKRAQPLLSAIMPLWQIVCKRARAQ